MYKNHSLAAGATQGYASYTHRYTILFSGSFWGYY